MPLDPHFVNPFQQKIDDQHTNNSKRLTIIHQNKFFYHTIILSNTPKKYN